MGKITITIKPEGGEPEVIEGVSGFSLVAIPEKDPDTNTSYFGNLDHKALAQVGVWLVTLSKSMRDGTEMRPLGYKPTQAEQRFIDMKRGKSERQTESGIYLPN